MMKIKFIKSNNSIKTFLRMFTESLKLHLENENVIRMSQRGFGKKKLWQTVLITFLNGIMIGLHRRKPGRHFIDGFSGKLSTRFHMMDYRIKPSKYGLGDECLRCLRNCLEDKNGVIKSAFLCTQAGIFHGGPFSVFSRTYIRTVMWSRGPQGPWRVAVCPHIDNLDGAVLQEKDISNSWHGLF